MSIVSDRLIELRERQGKTQEAVAEACNISRVTLARYENGTREPVAKNVSKLAQYYGVTVDYLLGRENYRPGWIKVETAAREAGMQPDAAPDTPVSVRAVVDVSGSMHAGKSDMINDILKIVTQLDPKQLSKAKHNAELLLLEQQIKDYFPKPNSENERSE